MTRNSWLLIGSLAFMVGVGLLAVESALIVLAIPLFIYLTVGVLHAPGEQKLHVQRVLSTDRITEGMEVTVTLQVEKESGRIEQLFLTDLAEYNFNILDGEPSLVTQLEPEEHFTVEYAFEGRRGNYRFESLSARAVDPFGLFEHKDELPAKGNLIVYPQITELKSIPIRPPQTKGFSGPITSRRSGSGVNFWGVRQYQLGDSLRRINWRVSEKHIHNLYTNEYEQERVADVGIIIDARPHCDKPYQGRRMFEYSVHAAASLSKMFLDEGHSISMLIYSAVVTQVFPGYGKVHYERILETLASADTSFNYAREKLRIPSRLLPPRGQLIYISPMPTADFEPIIRFHKLGYEVLVLSLDPLFFEEHNGKDLSLPEVQLAARFAKIERKLMLNNLYQAGVLVENWQVDQPFLEVGESIRSHISLHHRMVRGLW